MAAVTAVQKFNQSATRYVRSQMTSLRQLQQQPSLLGVAQSRDAGDQRAAFAC